MLDLEKTKAEIDQIVKTILCAVPALEIYLFGSFANGTAREDSDYDFYVVIPDEGMRTRQATWEIRYALPDSIVSSRPIDMLVGTKSKFDKYKTSLSFVEKEVARTGVKLYG